MNYQEKLIQEWMKQFDAIHKSQPNNWNAPIRVIDYNENKITIEEYLKEQIKNHKQ